MDGHSDASTREFTRFRLKLADEVIFTPHRYGQETYYHVELPSQSKFFRIGLAEYTFVSLLDGNTSVAEALSLSARSSGSDALDQQEATALCTWLVDNGLAVPQQASQANRLCGVAGRQRARNLAGRLNPFWWKLPLACPDPWIRRVAPVVGWIHSPAAMLAGLLLCVCGAVTAALHWERLVHASGDVFSAANWIGLLAAWMLLKLLHELGHAVVCKRYGGQVREVGIAFILLVPIPYVDVTSSWSFRSKWQRIHTAAAGMYVELLLAAGAMLIWSRAESPVVGHLLYGIVVMASATTVLFNANPLMRFDGYYILADLLEIPNLYATSGRYLADVAARVFLGAPAAAPLAWHAKDVLIRLYAVAVLGWRVLVCVSLAIAASVLFHGAGLILAAAGVGAWLVPPIARAARAVVHAWQRTRWAPVRAAVAAAVLAALAGGVLSARWPGACTAPGVVEYGDLVVVRAAAPGFVTAVHVRDGQLVHPGDLLLEMTNDQLATECRDLELAIEQSEAKRRICLERREQAAAQVERENGRALRKRLADKQRQLHALTCRAPIAGTVMARNLHTLVNTHLDEGDEILAVGDDTHKRMRVSIAQQDIPTYRAWVGKPVALRFRSLASIEGRLARIIPGASKEPPHQALCVPLGGPLAVTRPEDRRSEEAYQFVEPRFTGIVELPQPRCTDLHAGEFGCAIVGAAATSTIAQVLHRRVAKWLQSKLANARRRARQEG